MLTNAVLNKEGDLSEYQGDSCGRWQSSPSAWLKHHKGDWWYDAKSNHSFYFLPSMFKGPKIKEKNKQTHKSLNTLSWFSAYCVTKMQFGANGSWVDLVSWILTKQLPRSFLLLFICPRLWRSKITHQHCCMSESILMSFLLETCRWWRLYGGGFKRLGFDRKKK